MRLIIISNRLPVTIEKKDGKLNIRVSSGGLVSGLSSYLDSLKDSSFPAKTEFIWAGWPGIDIDEKDREELKSKLFNEYRAHTVFLSHDLMEKFYQGFCNKTIWPLFHYFPSFAEYDEEFWEYYNFVNEKFFEAISGILKPDDLIWIHDYHLMLLPKLIRDKMPDARIGFFLHIPFPNYEIFCLLPSRWRIDLLKGLLGADIIGFHTYDYTQYFLRCVSRILGLESDMGNIIQGGRLVAADTFPMGINFQKFQDALFKPEVKENINELKKILNYEKIILSIDRLDYTKGILNRLQAFEQFLEKNPQWIGKIILNLRVVPSRIGVDQYFTMKKQIDEFVGHLNGKFSSISWSPVSYQYDFLEFNALVALYNVSDVILVTPLRDGMNLIAKEYVASRTDKTGVLILSETAGASKELGEALIIHPNSREEIAAAIKKAIEMPVNEQIRRNEIMQKRLKRYDVVKWADDFIQKLISEKEEKIRTRLLDEKLIEQLTDRFRQSEKRLILLDYDGTLVPFADAPDLAAPDDSLLELINNLVKNKKTDLVIISGRERGMLQKWFDGSGIEIIAEHGTWLKGRDKEWIMFKTLSNYWKPQILSILEIYVDRLPGSFVEEKEFSLAWHYRKSDPELASIRTRELADHLLRFTANIDVQILKGNKVIEIRNAGINKGTAALKLISRDRYDFILAIGDDMTDEDLFKALPDYAYSIKVMSQLPDHSYSKFYLNDHVKVIELLNRLVY